MDATSRIRLNGGDVGCRYHSPSVSAADRRTRRNKEKETGLYTLTINNVAHHFEEVVEKAAEFLVFVELGDLVGLLSVAVEELAGVAGVRQVDQPRAQLLQAELGREMDQRR